MSGVTPSRSTYLDVLGRLLTAITDNLIFDRLTLIERTKAGTFDSGDMDEYVSAAIPRLNESIAFRRVESFHSASSIMASFARASVIPAARPSCDRLSEVSVAYRKAHREVRDKTRPSSNIETVRGSRMGFNRAKRSRKTSELPWTI